MTLNSSDEIEVFRKKLLAQGFLFQELVPQSKDPHWFKKACETGIECDVLVVSGHFGGLFFGQGTSSTIGLKELTQASCQKSCPGILAKPKEVYLMGCNTLADQNKDQRSLEDYLAVLLEDGIPLNYAEDVASARYNHQGFTLERKFAAIFPAAKKLYGFSSTGPLGKNAAPALNRYLERVGDYESHLARLSDSPNRLLSKNFAGSNFRETDPRKVLSQEDRTLFCDLRSDEIKVSQQALKQILIEDKFVNFFDSIAEIISGIGYELSPLFDSISLLKLKEGLKKIISTNRNLTTIQSEAVVIGGAFNLFDKSAELSQISTILEAAYLQPLNYTKITQICGVVSLEPKLQNLNVEKLELLSNLSPYFMLTLDCYHMFTPLIRSFLLDKIVRPNFTYERTIALEIMKKHWTLDDTDWLESVIQRGDAYLNLRLYLSARYILFKNRHNILSHEGLSACVAKSDDLGGTDLGTNWSCLTENQSELTVDICNHFGSLDEDPENSDDMRWYCWSHRKEHLLASRPECYLLSESMHILGNKMKQVWNCGHR